MEKEIKILMDYFEIPLEDLKKLTKICRVKIYDQDEVLFYQGEQSKELIFALDGYLGAYYVDDNYREIFLHLFNVPGLVSEPSSLEKSPYSFNIKAFTKSTVIYIDFDKFEEQFFHYNHILRKIIKSLCLKLNNYLHFVNSEKQNDRFGKVCLFIERFEDFFSNSCQQKDMAFILNITPQILSKHIKKLRDEGVIKKCGNHCKVIDREKLRSFINKFDFK